MSGDTPIEIKWSKEYGDTNVTVVNEKKKGIIKIIKTDADFNNYPIENAKFNIYDEDNRFIETITTNSNGIAQSSKLGIDKKYKIIECKTSDNYILDNTTYIIDFAEGLTKEQIIDIKTDTIKTIKLTNKHQKGNLIINKVDSKNSIKYLEGVSFELYTSKVDKPYEPNKLIGTYTTDKNGKIQINNLWTGSYLLKEVKTDIWHKLNTDNISFEIKANDTTTLTIKNEAKHGVIKIQKQDSEFSNIKIANVKFNIYDENKRFIETITTDKNGFAQSSLLEIDKNYLIIEISTDNNYILTDRVFKVNFVEGKTDKDIAAIKTDLEYNLTVKNESKTSSIKVIKVDADNNEYKISDVIFEIFDETLNKVVGTVRTDKNGEAVIDNLKVTHTYSIYEKIANRKYKLNNEKIQNIVLKPEEITSITFENEKKKGQVKVIKVDKDNTEYKISDVVFELLDSNMNVVETLITDKNGEAISSTLPCIDETYYLKETITGESYVLSNEITEITLKENQITSILFENEKIKGYLEITKVDSKDNSIKLKDAEFGIYNEDNELVEIIKTSENGIATSDLLVIGKYYVKELSSGSPYYLLNENTYEFEIVENNKIVPITIDNEAVEIKVNVNKTGTIEIKPGEVVNYEFSNIENNSNVYLDNFKWYDYIPTDYIKLQEMTTGIWNQDLNYKVYYKTNKSENYILFKEDLNSQENYVLNFNEIDLTEDEYITETCFDFGKVDIGFKETTSPTMKCVSFDTLNDKEVFTNITKTVGIYYGVTAETTDKWTTIVHKPEEKHKPELPRTGK